MLLGGLACFSISIYVFVFITKTPIASDDGADY